MSANIRSFIETQLLDPFKRYPTVIQDTMLEIITERLEALYELTIKFPEIVAPDSNRLDILKVIADQFLFTVREEADIQEQIDILDNIIYLYNKRGSIDTIENMWKYYGGDLPKNVKVVIPSYNLFRYSVSKLSGTHVFEDNNENRPGVYEIKLVNNDYPIPDLKEFMIKELVAAGNRIYFTNIIHGDITDSSTNPYKYDIYEDNLLKLQLSVFNNVDKGFTLSTDGKLSGHDITLGKPKNLNSVLSGRLVLLLEVMFCREMDLTRCNKYHLFKSEGFYIERYISTIIRYFISIKKNLKLFFESFLYCTPTESSIYVSRDLYDSSGEKSEDRMYKGYFVLNSSLLGEEVV